MYVVETGKCVKDRQRELPEALSFSLFGIHAINFSRSGCIPEFGRPKTLGSFRRTVRRKINEAYHVRREDSGFESAPRVVLLCDEFPFLEARGV